MRENPPFGEIPGSLRGDHVLRMRNDHTAVQLSGFCAQPAGVVAQLRATTVAPHLLDVEFGFEQHDPTGGPDHLTLTAEIPGRPDIVIGTNLVSGGGGQDGSIRARTYRMWWPVDIATIAEPDVLRITAAWVEADLGPTGIDLGATELAAAARTAIRFHRAT